MVADVGSQALSFEAWSHICGEMILSPKKIAAGSLDIARRHIFDITQGRCRFSAARTRQTDCLLATEAHLGSSTFQFLKWDWEGDCETSTVRRSDQNLVAYIPLKGTFEARQGRHWAKAQPGEILIVSSEGELHRNWRGSCDLLNVVLARKTLSRLLAVEFALDADRPLQFEPLVVISKERAATMFHFIETVLHDLSSPSPIFAEPMAGGQAERLLLHIVLKSVPHEYADDVRERRNEVAPYYVRRAEKFIDDHMDDDVTIEQLIEAAGVSARTLYYGFKQHRKMSPMKYLRRKRLMLAHAALEAPSAQNVKIADVARHAGYRNLSQFSRDYRKYFGVSPMDTVRRRGGGPAPVGN